MDDGSNERGGRPPEPRRDSRPNHDWDEAAADYQAGEDDHPGQGQSFERGYVGPRYGAGSYAGFTGGYGQNGSDPGERVSPYGDRVYRGGRSHGDKGRQGGGRYDSSPRQDHPGEYRTYLEPGHRGLGPQGYIRSDQRISEDVHDRLTEDDHIDASGITVAVQDGEVTLSGTIYDRRAKHHAEAIIEDIGGVKHVQNNLRLDAGATRRAPASLGENTILRDQAEGES
ncbi:BON domain-containing protein [Phenylobacterium sp.]|uniref:BON domain-containing protein n=1 Tax=Phenylobacterium sp. TaxID=1871053 RepID=UPI00286E5ABF|nr:BON domain-containing protein [Phenylobacterium sp.]